jgi:hypothetical protein
MCSQEIFLSKLKPERRMKLLQNNEETAESVKSSTGCIKNAFTITILR